MNFSSLRYADAMVSGHASIRRLGMEEEDKDDSASLNDRSNSNESGGNGNTGTTGESLTEEGDSKETKDDLSRRETERVHCLRYIFIAILVLVLFSMTVTFYHILSRGQTEEFETEYDATADKIISALNGKEVTPMVDKSSGYESIPSLVIHTLFLSLKTSFNGWQLSVVFQP